MSQAFNVAVLGATGLVGQTMMDLLAERNFPIDNLVPLASARSAGSEIEFKGKKNIFTCGRTHFFKKISSE